MLTVVLRHQQVDPLMIFALLLSCIVHDFVHPGLTSPFCMSYAPAISNLKAVLERMHIRAYHKVLELPECDILCDMRENKNQYRKFKEYCKTFVLSTDLSTHFLFLEKAKRILERERTQMGADQARTVDIPGMSMDKKHALFLRMCIKCADVGNATKMWDIYDQWADRIMQEFYMQGEIEQMKGMQITNYMNRKDPQKSACQHAFIEKIVMPIVELFAGFFPDARSFLLPNMRQNLAHHAPQTSKSTCGSP